MEIGRDDGRVRGRQRRHRLRAGIREAGDGGEERDDEARARDRQRQGAARRGHGRAEKGLVACRCRAGRAEPADSGAGRTFLETFFGPIQPSIPTPGSHGSQFRESLNDLIC